MSFDKAGYVVNGRELMGLLTLEGHQGAEILVTVEGPEAQRVLDNITEIFNEGFRFGLERKIDPVPAAHSDTIVIEP